MLKKRGQGKRVMRARHELHDEIQVEKINLIKQRVRKMNSGFIKHLYEARFRKIPVNNTICEDGK